MWGAKNDPAFASQESCKSGSMLSDLDLKILWISRTLSEIDYQYEPEFIRLRQSPVHKDLKKLMRKALISTYRRKRAPYVKLIAELRSQQCTSGTAKV